MATVDGRLGHDICFYCHSKAGYSHNPLCHVGLTQETAALKRENEAAKKDRSDLWDALDALHDLYQHKTGQISKEALTALGRSPSSKANQ